MGKLALVGIPVEVNALIEQFIKDNGISAELEIVEVGKHKGFISNRLVQSTYICCFVTPDLLNQYKNECSEKYERVKGKLIAYHGEDSIKEYLSEAFKIVNQPQVVDMENFIDISELTALEEQYEESQNNVTTLNGQVEDLRTKVADALKENEQLQNKINELTEESNKLHETESKLNTIVAERDSIKEQLEKAKEGKDSLNEELKNLREEYSKLEKDFNDEKTKAVDIIDIDEQIKSITAELKADLEKKNQEINTLKSNLTDKEKEVVEKLEEIVNLKEEIANLKKEIIHLKEEIAVHLNQIESLKVDIETANSTAIPDERINKLQGSINYLTEIVRKLNSEKEKDTARIAELTEEVKSYNDIQNDYNKLKTSNDLLQAEHEALQTTCSDKETEIGNLNTEIESLKDQLEQEKESNANNQENETAIMELENQIATLNSQIANLNATIKQNEEDYADLSGKYGQLQVDFNSAKENDIANFNTAQEANNQIKTLANRVEEIALRKGVEEQLNTAKNEYDKLVKSIKANGDVTEEINEKLANMSDEINKANETANSYKERLDVAVKFEGMYNDLKDKYDKVVEQGKTLEEQANTYATQLAEKEREIQQNERNYEATIKAKDTEIGTLNNTVTHFKNAVDQYKSAQETSKDDAQAINDKLNSANEVLNAYKNKLNETNKVAITERNRADGLQAKLDNITKSSYYKMAQPLEISCGKNVRLFVPVNVQSIEVLYDEVIKSIKGMKGGKVTILDLSSETYLNKAINFSQTSFDFVDGKIKDCNVAIKVYSMAMCGVVGNSILTLKTGLNEIISQADDSLIIIADSLTSDLTLKLYTAMPNIKKSLICKVSPLSLWYLDFNTKRYSLDENTIIYAVSGNVNEPPALSSLLQKCSERFPIKRLKGSLL